MHTVQSSYHLRKKRIFFIKSKSKIILQKVLTFPYHFFIYLKENPNYVQTNIQL